MGSNLADRVAQRANAAGTDVAQRASGAVAPQTLADKIRAMEGQFQLAAPKGLEATQLIRDALTAMRTTKNLDRCDHASVLGGLMTCAQLGLRPGVLGHAWLIPFWNSKADNGRGGKGAHQAQLVIGYQGLVDLAYRSDRILSIASRTVYANDEFRLSYSLEDDFFHQPTLDGERGAPRLFYAIARLKGGGVAMTDPMTVAEMEAYRDRHATAKTKEGRVVGPWVDNFEGMAQKTMLRRLAKLLPKSTELAAAISADERVHVNLDPQTFPAGDYIDGEVVSEDGVDTTTGEVPAGTGEGAPAGGDQ